MNDLIFWEDEEGIFTNEINYQVSYYDYSSLPQATKICFDKLFYRKHDKPYQERIESNDFLLLPLFRLTHKQLGLIKHTWARKTSLIVTAARVRRIVLLDEIAQIKVEFNKWNKVLVLCQEKIDGQSIRLDMLEHELILYSPVNRLPTLKSKFASYLSHGLGWNMVTSLIPKEYAILIMQEIRVRDLFRLMILYV